MSISHIHSFLVRPQKGSDERRQMKGVSIPSNGRMFDLLKRIFDRSSLECDIDICFRADEEGSQVNPCRDLIIAYMSEPTLRTGRQIAHRLEEHTDRRSGLGLLFLIYGQEGRRHKFVLSRFPTDEAILAEEDRETLSVKFLDQVFLKNKHSYKAVQFEDTSLRAGFWEGKAIDKQNSEFGYNSTSNYWIGDFLCSDLSITPAAGTRRLAQVMKEAARKSEMGVKSEIMAAVTLATGLRDRRTSVAEVEERFSLSSAARDAIRKELKDPSAATERFIFDHEEFRNNIGYRNIELNNGGIMSAPAGEFDAIFTSSRLRSTDDEYQFTTRGKIIDDKLKRLS